MATKRSKRSRGAGIFLLLILVIAALVYPHLKGNGDTPNEPVTPVDGQILLHVIDVGQGDAILLTTPDGHMLVDAGDNTKASELALTSYLDSLGIEELEYFVLTHAHADHIGGADVILTEYRVNNVLMTADAATSGVYEAMLDALEKSEANVIEAKAGETFSLGEARCRILAPLKDYSDTNDTSIALRISYGEVSMLLTGDAETPSENDMLARYTAAELQSDFFKAGHHGSDTSNSAAFLAAVRPKLVAISVGEGNRYGHPVASALSAFDAIGARVLRTDLSGTLVFVCDGESIEYRE